MAESPVFAEILRTRVWSGSITTPFGTPCIGHSVELPNYFQMKWSVSKCRFSVSIMLQRVDRCLLCVGILCVLYWDISVL